MPDKCPPTIFVPTEEKSKWLRNAEESILAARGRKHRYKRGRAKSGRGGKGGKVKSRKQAIAIALSKARHLSVGLKIHCLDQGSQFTTLVDGLGGAQKILDINYYKHSSASLCLALPPVGNARSAILLMEAVYRNYALQ